jgi:hypothetical protein
MHMILNNLISFIHILMIEGLLLKFCFLDLYLSILIYLFYFLPHYAYDIPVITWLYWLIYFIEVLLLFYLFTLPAMLFLIVLVTIIMLSLGVAPPKMFIVDILFRPRLAIGLFRWCPGVALDSLPLFPCLLAVF